MRHNQAFFSDQRLGTQNPRIELFPGSLDFVHLQVHRHDSLSFPIKTSNGMIVPSVHDT